MKFLRVFLVWILVIACSSKTDSPPSVSPQSDHSQFLDSISRKDRNCLRLFIRDLVWWNQAAYVLLGDKPMALGCFEKNRRQAGGGLKVFLGWISSRRSEINRGFRVWKRYKEFFSSSKYIMLYELLDGGIEGVYLINKEAFAKKIKESKDLFERCIGESNPETLFELMKTMPLFGTVLKQRHDLLGVLLGFGEKNACLYQKFYAKRLALNKEERKAFDQVNNFSPAWSKEESQFWIDRFPKDVSWIDLYIKRKLPTDPHLIASPGFMCNRDSEETRKIKKEFVDTRKKIIETYAGRDPLEVTLELLWR